MGRGVLALEARFFFIVFVSDKVGGSMATSVMGNLDGRGAKSLAGFVGTLVGFSTTESSASVLFWPSPGVELDAAAVGTSFFGAALFLAAFMTAVNFGLMAASTRRLKLPSPSPGMILSSSRALGHCPDLLRRLVVDAVLFDAR